MRALVKRHQVGWRTVRAALDDPQPPPRKPLPRRPTAIDPVQELVDAMIETGRTPMEIWTALTDEHDTSIAYGTIRLYVQNRGPRHTRQRASVSSNQVRAGQRLAPDY